MIKKENDNDKGKGGNQKNNGYCFCHPNMHCGATCMAHTICQTNLHFQQKFVWREDPSRPACPCQTARWHNPGNCYSATDSTELNTTPVRRHQQVVSYVKLKALRKQKSIPPQKSLQPFTPLSLVQACNGYELSVI